MNILSVLLSALVGYLLGSVNFAIILSKLFKKEDIRIHGSGNAGMTNMVRIYGVKYGVLTLIGDVFKGVIATILGGLICKYLGGDLITQLAGLYLGGTFAIIGHIFPVFFRFKGGKAIATSAGVVGVINPTVIIILFLIFVLVVLISRYISLGSIVSAAAYPFLTAISSFIYNRPVLMETLLATLIASLAIYMHRSNIKRLLSKTENKFSFKKSD